MARKEGTPRFDQGAALKGGAPKKHAEAHLIAVGERKLDRPGAVAEHHAGLDDVAALDQATRVAHGALVDRRRLAFDLHRARALGGMHLEAHPERAGSAERLDGKGVQSAGPGAGVDLGLDGGDAEIGQPHPFAPAYPQFVARVCAPVAHAAEELISMESHCKALAAVLPMGSLASCARPTSL